MACNLGSSTNAVQQQQYNSNNTATITACDKNKIPELYVSRFRKYKKATFDRLTTVIFKIFIFK
jgi:hypothetical protein